MCGVSYVSFDVLCVMLYVVYELCYGVCCMCDVLCAMGYIACVICHVTCDMMDELCII